MSSRVRRWAIGLSLLLIVVGIAASDPPKLTVEVSPTSLQIPAEGSGQATLVVHNPTELTARQVQVNHTDLPGVTVEIEPAASQTIPSNTASVWTLKIGQTGAGTVSGDVSLQVHYTLVDQNGEQFSDVLLTKITVSSRDQEDTSQIMAVTVHTTLAELNDFRPGYIYLQVENKSDGPIEITDIIVSERPDFIVLKPSINMTPIPAEESRIPFGDLTQIPAGEVRVFPIYVASGDQVRPGEHMLVFNVMFERTVNGQTQTGSVVAEHTLKVKVFGEEEVLGVIASVTTFLFVPGFLIVVVAGMAWKVFVPGAMKDQFPFSIEASTITDPRFWVTVVTLSLLMAWKGYPALSGWLLEIGRRDFLYGYGFQDIVWMWLFSISIGGIFSLLASAVIWSDGRIKARRRKLELRRAIKTTDQPMDVLGKIVNQGFDEVRFKEATITAPGENLGKKGVLIEHQAPGKEELWIAPRIAIWWHEDDGGLQDRAIEVISDEDAHLGDLLKILEEGLALGQGRGIGYVNWDRRWIADSQGVPAPTRVPESGLDIPGDTKNIFTHCPI